jgi:hypothetical protein
LVRLVRLARSGTEWTSCRRPMRGGYCILRLKAQEAIRSGACPQAGASSLDAPAPQPAHPRSDAATRSQSGCIAHAMCRVVRPANCERCANTLPVAGPACCVLRAACARPAAGACRRPWSCPRAWLPWRRTRRSLCVRQQRHSTISVRPLRDALIVLPPAAMPPLNARPRMPRHGRNHALPSSAPSLASLVVGGSRQSARRLCVRPVLPQNPRDPSRVPTVLHVAFPA